MNFMKKYNAYKAGGKGGEAAIEHEESATQVPDEPFRLHCFSPWSRIRVITKPAVDLISGSL